MSAYTTEVRSRSVSILTLSARIAESGDVTPLPETTRPVGWAEHYVRAGQNWQRMAEARVNEELAPLLAEIKTAKPAANVEYLYPSLEGWRSATERETRRTVGEEAYKRAVDTMRQEALTIIDAKGAAFWPAEWEESDRPYRVQGEWTVTVSLKGSDHQAVRQVFRAGLDNKRDEILADPQKRIPRVSGTFRGPTDTPERVRSTWRRDRRKGTAPKPATASYSPGSWVTWQHPQTGQVLTGIVTKWLLGERTDSVCRTLIPSDGSDPVEMTLKPGAKPTAGPWKVIYGPEVFSLVQAGVQHQE
ncbi:hypothetical protein [Streptomyces sp. NPDC053720]|uniref:hypothetical protein n=1 Tax=Streptomyces sp. NPDC053720 TaxID=3154855 RepID=UPI00343F9F55